VQVRQYPAGELAQVAVGQAAHGQIVVGATGAGERFRRRPRPGGVSIAPGRTGCA
jgi:hypothetical protein